MPSLIGLGRGHRVTSCSRASSLSVCPKIREHRIMLAGLSDLVQAYLSILNPTSIAYGLGGALHRHHGRLPARPFGHALHRAAHHAHLKLPTNDAILILICSYVGTLYGGSRTAILLNIPGTAANAASCADGHALALRGEAGRAIGIATSGAFTGTLFGVLCLAAFTPVLARGRALIRLLRVLLAGAVRRHHVRQHRRQRPAEGLADGRCSACSWRRSARTDFMPMTASPSGGASSRAASR